MAGRAHGHWDASVFFERQGQCRITPLRRPTTSSGNSSDAGSQLSVGVRRRGQVWGFACRSESRTGSHVSKLANVVRDREENNYYRDTQCRQEPECRQSITRMPMRDPRTLRTTWRIDDYEPFGVATIRPRSLVRERYRMGAPTFGDNSNNWVVGRAVNGLRRSCRIVRSNVLHMSDYLRRRTDGGPRKHVSAKQMQDAADRQDHKDSVRNQFSIRGSRGEA